MAINLCGCSNVLFKRFIGEWAKNAHHVAEIMDTLQTSDARDHLAMMNALVFVMRRRNLRYEHGAPIGYCGVYTVGGL